MEKNKQLYLRGLVNKDLGKGNYTPDERMWRQELMTELLKESTWAQPQP